jgi:glyoxylase-like metal-dependent hydrolase (beta-lactamase superfamily II)
VSARTADSTPVTRRALLVAGAAWPLSAGAQSMPFKVGQFTSARRAYSTHSYWIEGPEGLVLVDTQFLPSDAVRFVDEAERQTSKKAKLAVVLHPNPDKFNGTATLQARGIQVVTSAQVLALIPSVHQIRLGWFYDEFKPDYPKDAPKPSAFGNATTVLQAAGLPLTLHVLGGPGCSGAHVVLQVGQGSQATIFVGDLLASRGHAWLELALFDEWLKRLNELDAMKPQQVYVGRGPSGGAEIIAANRAYLQKVHALVQAEKPTGELGFFKRRTLKNAITSAFPGYDWEAFVHESLPEIWRKLATPG